MKRRSFLKSLSAAPIAAPIIAAQAKESIVTEASKKPMTGWMNRLSGGISQKGHTQEAGGDPTSLGETHSISVDDFIKAYFKQKQKLRFRSSPYSKVYFGTSDLRSKIKSALRQYEVFNSFSGEIDIRPLKSVKNLEFMVDVALSDNKERIKRNLKNSSDAINNRRKNAVFKKMMLNLMSPEFMLLDEESKYDILQDFKSTLRSTDDEKDSIFKIGDSFFSSAGSVCDSEDPSE